MVISGLEYLCYLMQLSIYAEPKQFHIDFKVKEEFRLTFKSQNKIRLHKEHPNKAKQDGFGNYKTISKTSTSKTTTKTQNQEKVHHKSLRQNIGLFSDFPSSFLLIHCLIMMFTEPRN